MKRICISITALMLAALILLGSGKFTVGKMTCMENGQSSYSFGNAKDCCDKKNTQHETLKKICCNLINVSYSLGDCNPSQKINISPLYFDSHLLSSLACNLRLNSLFSRTILTVPDLPPPDIKDLLHSLCSLLL